MRKTRKRDRERERDRVTKTKELRILKPTEPFFAFGIGAPDQRVRGVGCGRHSDESQRLLLKLWESVLEG